MEWYWWVIIIVAIIAVIPIKIIWNKKFTEYLKKKKKSNINSTNEE